MTEKIHLDKLEFYITNVCNLTCSNCNRYNNFHFKGWAKWDDYAEGLEQLSRHVHVQKPVILGGEPLLNPDIVKWINGLQRLWPHHRAGYGRRVTAGARIFLRRCVQLIRSAHWPEWQDRRHLEGGGDHRRGAHH